MIFSCFRLRPSVSAPLGRVLLNSSWQMQESSRSDVHPADCHEGTNDGRFEREALGTG
jgi:hypothetical protein